MSRFSKYLAVGCGGINCSCCFPPRGHRDLEFRKAKRKENVTVDKETEQELQDWWDASFPEETDD